MVRQFAFVLFFLCFCSVTASSQSNTGQLNGKLTDPAGYLIPGAEVVLTRESPNLTAPQTSSSSKTDASGAYHFSYLSPGSYTLSVDAPGFAPLHRTHVVVRTEGSTSLNLKLEIAGQQDEVDVSSDAVSATDPENNATGITLKNRDIDLLPDDSSLMLQQLKALAGGSDAQLYVDGYSNGSLPPKDTIREIRINQNLYSAKNDVNPYAGIVEVFTKPGSGKVHASLSAYGDSSALNTNNPFIQQQPAYDFYDLFGNISGPISKRASYFLNGGQYFSDSNSIIAAAILDSNGNQTTFNQAIPTSSRSFNISPRFDFQIGKGSTVSLRYSAGHGTQASSGGGLTLASQGSNSSSLYQTVQASNAQAFGAKIVNDTRFQLSKSDSESNPLSTDPSLIVSGAFNGGGSPAGHSKNSTENYEFQNYLYLVEGKHYLNVGVRVRAFREASTSAANFNGQYLFPSLSAYQITLKGQQSGLSAAQIRTAGGGASQFTLTAGNPSTTVAAGDISGFYQDDWKLTPNLTLSYGLRYEAQSHVTGEDWAPRFGFSWGFGGKPKQAPRFVLGGGTGIFYRRFLNDSIFNAAQQNGVSRQTYVVPLPDTYPLIPNPASLGSQLLPSIYRISPKLKAESATVFELTLSHPITGKGKNGNIRLDTLYAKGQHDNLIRNMNAPLPGTYDPTNPSSGVRPLGGTQIVNEYESGGNSYYFRFAPGVNIFTSKFSLYATYRLIYAQTDTNNGFPSNGYNLLADRGRPNIDFDARNQLSLGGSANLPYGITSNLNIQTNSGLPFNIVVGQDLNGDSQYNDRPTFATDLTRASVVVTKFGTFDTSPLPGQKVIPIDYGRSPAYLDIGFTLGRNWNFGPKPEAPARPSTAKGPAPKLPGRYAFNLSATAENVINHVNLAQPIGTLNSPLFGKSVAIAPSFVSSANRVILLQTRFSF